MDDALHIRNFYIYAIPIFFWHRYKFSTNLSNGGYNFGAGLEERE